MVFKLFKNALILSSLIILLLVPLNERGRFGVTLSNAEVERRCEVDEHGEKSCGMKFSLNDFDEDTFDADDEFSDDYEFEKKHEVEENTDARIAEKKEEVREECVDTHELCPFWASHGECEKNPGYMLVGCPLSCDQCNKKIKGQLMESPDKILDERQMLIESSKIFGVEQTVNGEQSMDTLLVIRKSLSYMENFVRAEKPTHIMSAKTISACKNKQALCAFWAGIGECEKNLSYMLTNCAPSCLSCHKIDFNTRCPPRDPDQKPAWQPGDLHTMFQRIVTHTTYPDITVYSRPSQPNVESVSTKLDKLNDPWIITIDNFLTDEECDELIKLGYDEGYKRSKDVSSSQNDDGSFEGYENDRRTSNNAWCSERTGCRHKPVVQRIHNRIEEITNIPAINSEDLQILKYEEGEYYREHHDFIDHQVDRANGPRILTVFLYLSDVQEGGGTAFPSLKHTVNPKKGRVLLWPSVMNSDPILPDHRMRHEALQVIKGTKFAANAWIHLYDNVTPTRTGCA